MTLLIITDSADFTADLVVERLATCVFRLNSDMIRDYIIEWRSEGFSLKSPTRTINDADVTSVYWRKPFSTDEFSEVSTSDHYFYSECRYLLREIYNFLVANGVHALVEEGAERRIGKIRQLQIARSFFRIPSWYVSLGVEQFAKDRTIVKSLSGTPTDADNVLYTTRVDGAALDATCIWFQQDAISNLADVTVCYALGKLYAFEMEARLEFTDWRETIFSLDENSWKPVQLGPILETQIDGFMKQCLLKYGRIDFIRGDSGLTFLEVNPNGQWAWLDPDDRYGLLSAMLSAITNNG